MTGAGHAIAGETELLVFSGRDRGALLATLDRAADRLASGDGLNPDDLRSHSSDPERLAIVAPANELAQRISLARERLPGLRRPRLVVRDRGIYFGAGANPGRLAFLFPGEGSQRVGMLRQAYERLAPLRTWFDALDQTYRHAGGLEPSRLIYPPPELSNAEREEMRRDLFDIAHGGQLCTVANLAFFEVLQLLGVTPDVMIGHSNGEHAAVMAVCMEPSRNRERVCQWLRMASIGGLGVRRPDIPERMLAVAALDMSVLMTIVGRYPGALFLAMDNSPLQQVIAGTEAAVRAAASDIASVGGMGRMLPFERAYHTPHFAGWAAVLARCYADLPLKAPRQPVFSCATAAEMPADLIALRDVMVAQWTAPVRLRETVLALYEAGVRTFVEVGPDSKLSSLVEDTLRGRPHLAAACASSEQNDLTQLQRLLAALHAQGLDVDPSRLRRMLIQSTPVSPPGSAEAPNRFAPAAARQAALIAVARSSMDRMEQVFRATLRAPPVCPAGARVGGLLGDCLRWEGGRLVGERRLSHEAVPFLRDHSFVRPPGRPLTVLSFTSSLLIAAEAARRLADPTGLLVLRDLRASRWLAFDHGGLDVRIEAIQAGPDIRVHLFDEAMNASFAVSAAISQTAPGVPALDGDLRVPRRWSAESFYADYAFHGPCFQGLKRVTGIGPHGICAELQVIDLPGVEQAALEADPALLDCAGQMVAFWLLEQQGLARTIGAFPYAAERVVLHAPPPPIGSTVTCRVSVALRGDSFTRADAVFTAQGHPLATIIGLEQRVMRFPPVIAACLFGRGTADRPDRVGDVAGWFEGQGGIWARVLAHALLDDTAFAVWQRDRDLNWLMDRIGATESIGG
jgi:acyl transferase domain-containing protein